MIVGVSGKIGSGKNEVADMISYLHFVNPDGTFEQFQKQQWIRDRYLEHGMYDSADLKLPGIHSFACNLKQCVAACTGVDYHDLEKRSLKSTQISWLNISFRQLLQALGEAVRCQINENFWVYSMLATYQDSDFWIVSDVRYKNEADELLSRGALLIRINRESDNSDTHQSEVDLDSYDKFSYIIENDGSLEDLYNKVKEIYQTVFNPSSLGS